MSLIKFRICNKHTGETCEVDAYSIWEACCAVGWRKKDCWYLEVGRGRYPGNIKWYQRPRKILENLYGGKND